LGGGQKHGLSEPEEVVNATIACRDSEDVIKRFVKDTGLVFDPELWITKKQLQELWSEWCKCEGVRTPIGDLNSRLENDNDWYMPIGEHRCSALEP